MSEAAGVNSAAGSFGLSFGLAVAGAIMLASLAIGFTQLSASSTVLHRRRADSRWPRPSRKTRRSSATRSCSEILAGQPEATQTEILRINDQARELALQIALLIPILAGVLGFANAFRMVRTPEPKPSGAAEGMLLG